MNTLKDEFRKAQILLCSRPEMILGSNCNYKSFANFLKGYECGIRSIGGADITTFETWLHFHLEIQFALSPYNYIEKNLSQSSDDAKAQLIFYFSMYIDHLSTTQRIIKSFE